MRSTIFYFFERKNTLENNQLMYILINRAMYLKNSGCQSRLAAICASLSPTENPDEFAYFKSLSLDNKILIASDLNQNMGSSTKAVETNILGILYHPKYPIAKINPAHNKGAACKSG
jgi:hypothetical protein